MKGLDSTEKSLCAGIVLYDPDIDRLCENIAAVMSQVDKVIFVDNHSLKIKEIMDIVSNMYPNRAIWILNKKNEGIAFALNQIIEEAFLSGFLWVLTLDQDSICGRGLVELLLKAVDTDSNIAMASPYIVDVNVTSLEEYKALHLPNIEHVSMCITSGCLTSVPAVRTVGGFNNALFIDQVDHEMCIRLRQAGYKVVRVNQAYILHEVGKTLQIYLIPKLAKITGNRWISRPKYIFNHSPIRVYYQTRNLVYMLKTYPGCMGKSNIGYWAGYCRGMILKLMLEPQKAKKLAAFIRGLVDGMKLHIDK